MFVNIIVIKFKSYSLARFESDQGQILYIPKKNLGFLSLDEKRF